MGVVRPAPLSPGPAERVRSLVKSLAVPALASISVTNALYFRWWTRLTIRMPVSQTYYLDAFHSASFTVSFLLSFLAVAAVLFGGFVLISRRSVDAETRLFQIAASLILLFFLLRVPAVRTSHVRMAAATIGLLGVLYALRRALSGLARPIVAAAGALFFIQATSCAWAYSRLPSSARLNNGPTVSAVPGVESKPHVLWIIFDELDYELATDLRPASVRMPNFDRLREESLWASAAHSPANWTSIALPALVSGKRLSWVRPEGPSELYIWDATKKPVLWQDQPTIFSYARQKGLNSAVVGWYHPYCRIFNSDLAGCFWSPSADATDTIREQFVFGEHVRPIWPANRGVSPAGEYEIVAREHEKEYRDTLRHARSILTDKKMNLIVLHWPVPHPPAIYDRNLDRIVTRPGLNYLDNLELVDFTLGEIRNTLEREGMWDNFAVVVTGDHPLRPNVWGNRLTWTHEEATLTARRKQPRVPLLIKLPQVNRPSVYDSPVDTVLIHDLTKRWIEGQDLTPAAVTTFLNENRGRFPVDLARKSPDAPTAERLPD